MFGLLSLKNIVFPLDACSPYGGCTSKQEDGVSCGQCSILMRSLERLANGCSARCFVEHTRVISQEII